MLADAEHTITTAEFDGSTVAVDGPSLRVVLEGGCGGTLQLRMRRFDNEPTLAWPLGVAAEASRL